MECRAMTRCRGGVLRMIFLEREPATTDLGLSFSRGLQALWPKRSWQTRRDGVVEVKLKVHPLSSIAQPGHDLGFQTRLWLWPSSTQQDQKRIWILRIRTKSGRLHFLCFTRQCACSIRSCLLDTRCTYPLNSPGGWGFALCVLFDDVCVVFSDTSNFFQLFLTTLRRHLPPRLPGLFSLFSMRLAATLVVS